MYSKLFFIILLNSVGVSLASDNELQKELENERSRFKSAMEQLLIFSGKAKSKKENSTFDIATVLPSLEDKSTYENLMTPPEDTSLPLLYPSTEKPEISSSLPILTAKKEKRMRSVFESRSMLSEIEEERVPKETISASHWQLIRGVGFKANDTICDLSLKYFKLGLSLYQAPIFAAESILRNHAIEYANGFLTHARLSEDSPIIKLEALTTPNLIQHAKREVPMIGIEYFKNELLISYILTQLNPNSAVIISKASLSFHVIQQENNFILNPKTSNLVPVSYEGEILIDREENEKKRLARNLFILAGNYMNRYLQQIAPGKLDSMEQMDLKLSALKMYRYATCLGTQNPKIKEILNPFIEPFLSKIKGKKKLSILNNINEIKYFEEKAKKKLPEFIDVFTKPGSRNYTERDLAKTYKLLTGEEANVISSENSREIIEARSTLMTYIEKRIPLTEIPNGEILFKKVFGLSPKEITNKLNNRIQNSKEWIKKYDEFNKYFLSENK